VWHTSSKRIHYSADKGAYLNLKRRCTQRNETTECGSAQKENKTKFKEIQESGTDLQKICTRPAGEFEQANLQTVRGQAPIKISLQTEHMVRNSSSQKHVSSHVSDSSHYLPLPVTLRV